MEVKSHGKSRRDFIRKATYTAPALVVLGAAAHSPLAKAQLLPSNPNPPGGVATDDAEFLEELESDGEPKGG